MGKDGKEWENNAEKGSNERKEMKGSGSGVSTTEFSSGRGARARCGRVLFFFFFFAHQSLAHGCTQSTSPQAWAGYQRSHLSITPG